MISYEQFLNKLMNCSGEKNLKLLLVKWYHIILRREMIFIWIFIHESVVRDIKNITSEDYVSGLLEHYNKYKGPYFKRVKEIENGGPWYNVKSSEREYLKNQKVFLEIMDDYLDFVDMTKNFNNFKITPLEFLEKFINKVNSFSITYKSSPEQLYQYLDFDWVESFGYDDGIHDVLRNHNVYWSEEHKLGYIIHPSGIDHFDDKHSLKLRLTNLKDSLDKHSF